MAEHEHDSKHCCISRHEKSLGVLTSKFVTLLKNSPNGVLDLKCAAEVLSVTQKRRIYDITNVLEGIGLIEKKNKNVVRWKGSKSIEQYQIPNNIDSLKIELAHMKKYETTLETHIQQSQQSVKNILEDEKNASKTYMLDSDLVKCFEDNVFLAVKAPPGTRLEVPIINHNEENCKPNYKIHLKSFSNPIEVFYLQKGSNLEEIINLKNINLAESEDLERCHSNNLATTPNPDNRNLTEDMVEASIVLGDIYQEFSLSDVEKNVLEDCYKNDVFNPFLRLSPPPNSRDYSFNLADSEGISDLFDVPMVMK